MAGPSRLSAEDVASYCVGDKPPGTHLDDFFERVVEEERLEVDSIMFSPLDMIVTVKKKTELNLSLLEPTIFTPQLLLV